ncbi:MAG: hypothetical protein AABX25_02285 [Nanoarchaeota archaeon]
MQDIQTIITLGYKSLASETLQHFDMISPDLRDQPREFAEWLATYRASLESLRETGDIKSLSNEGRDSLKAAIEILDMGIPAPFKPHDPLSSISFALNIVQLHLNIPSAEELISKMGLKGSYKRADGNGGFVWSDEDGKLAQYFCPSFDPNRPALSAIGDVHEIIHALQTETVELHRRFSQRREVRRLLDLESRLNSSGPLKNRLAAMVTKEHQLTYFLDPEVQEIARGMGVDMEHLDRYLKEHLPAFNFLYCFVEGDAFLKTVDMLRNPQLVQRAPKQINSYILMALTYALLAPSSEPKPKVYEVGVGMVRHMRNNPGEQATLSSSREFHEELTRTYFQRAF